MSPHEAMMERVAKAIAAARVKEFGSGAGLKPRDIEFDYARAAIEAISAGAEPVAWMDDGRTRAGSHDTSFRVVTAQTKAGMPRAAAVAYTTPLYASPPPPEKPGPEWRYAIGDAVQKTKGSSWHGHVVGFYTTTLTPRGYAVESEREPGSVQIYPEAALRQALRAARA